MSLAFEIPSTDRVLFVELAAREEPCRKYFPKELQTVAMPYPVRQDSIRLIGTGSGAFGDMGNPMRLF